MGIAKKPQKLNCTKPKKKAAGISLILKIRGGGYVVSVKEGKRRHFEPKKRVGSGCPFLPDRRAVKYLGSDSHKREREEIKVPPPASAEKHASRAPLTSRWEKGRRTIAETSLDIRG